MNDSISMLSKISYKLLLLVLLVFQMEAVSAGEGIVRKTVMYINSFHQEHPWAKSVTEAVINNLHHGYSHKAILWDIRKIYMDTKRNPSTKFAKSIAASIKRKIEQTDPDIVILADDMAVEYLYLPYFTNSHIPFIFCGLNTKPEEYNLPYPNITGMVEGSLVQEIIQQLKNYAQGNRIGLLAEDVPSERKLLNYHNKVLNIYYDRVYFVKSFAEWKEKYLKLQTEVDMMMLFDTINLPDWDAAQAEELVHTYTSIPVGTENAWQAQFALLGITKIPEEQGRWAAETALDILDGGLIQSILITHSKKGRLFINLKLGNELGIAFKRALLRTAEIIH